MYKRQVLGLLAQEQGQDRFKSFLKQVALFQGEMEDLLWSSFPSLNTGPKGIHKWWALQVAQMSLPKMTEILSIQESEAQLEQALWLALIDEEQRLQRAPLFDYLKLIELKDAYRQRFCYELIQRLVKVSQRSFPIYRQIIEAYIALIYQWSLGEDPESVIVLESLEREREMIVQVAQRGEDYLDWFIITQRQQALGDFESYKQLKTLFKKQRELKSDDLIDPYLDQIQQVWSHQ